MQAYLISDGEFLSPRQKQIKQQLTEYFTAKGFSILEKTLERDSLAFCRGCFDCWVKTPGECIMKDGIVEINRACMTSDVVVYLCPVIFGQFSANMKYAIDRWLPNMLPFFITRDDGSTMHSPRYRDYAAQVFIGYGETLSPEESQLFIDINKKHRSNVTVIIDERDNDKIVSALNAVSLSRVGGAL
ncbi:MAG: NAD(P)H-dependent oxidoreductase [Eubacteriales bacterium]|nr:NAD(P)H-dependent oxidoreductase [Eubacteriales bacterium]